MSTGRYMVWISQEVREELEEFIRRSFGMKANTNVTEIVNLAEVVRKAICFAVSEKKDEFRSYLVGG